MHSNDSQLADVAWSLTVILQLVLSQSVVATNLQKLHNVALITNRMNCISLAEHFSFNCVPNDSKLAWADFLHSIIALPCCSNVGVDMLMDTWSKWHKLTQFHLLRTLKEKLFNRQTLQPYSFFSLSCLRGTSQHFRCVFFKLAHSLTSCWGLRLWISRIVWYEHSSFPSSLGKSNVRNAGWWMG